MPMIGVNPYYDGSANRTFGGNEPNQPSAPSSPSTGSNANYVDQARQAELQERNRRYNARGQFYEAQKKREEKGWAWWANPTVDMESLQKRQNEEAQNLRNQAPEVKPQKTGWQKFWSGVKCATNFVKGATVGFVKKTYQSMCCDENGNFSWKKTLTSAAVVGVAVAACAIPGVGPVISAGLLAYGLGSSAIAVAQNAAKVYDLYSKGEYEMAEAAGYELGVETTNAAMCFAGGMQALKAMKAARAAQAAQAANRATSIANRAGKLANLADDAIAMSDKGKLIARLPIKGGGTKELDVLKNITRAADKADDMLPMVTRGTRYARNGSSMADKAKSAAEGMRNSAERVKAAADKLKDMDKLRKAQQEARQAMKDLAPKLKDQRSTITRLESQLKSATSKSQRRTITKQLETAKTQASQTKAQMQQLGGKLKEAKAPMREVKDALREYQAHARDFAKVARKSSNLTTRSNMQYLARQKQAGFRGGWKNPLNLVARPLARIKNAGMEVLRETKLSMGFKVKPPTGTAEAAKSGWRLTRWMPKPWKWMRSGSKMVDKMTKPKPLRVPGIDKPRGFDAMSAAEKAAFRQQRAALYDQARTNLTGRNVKLDPVRPKPVSTNPRPTSPTPAPSTVASPPPAPAVTNPVAPVVRGGRTLTPSEVARNARVQQVRDAVEVGKQWVYNRATKTWSWIWGDKNKPTQIVGDTLPRIFTSPNLATRTQVRLPYAVLAVSEGRNMLGVGTTTDEMMDPFRAPNVERYDPNAAREQGDDTSAPAGIRYRSNYTPVIEGTPVATVGGTSVPYGTWVSSYDDMYGSYIMDDVPGSYTGGRTAGTRFATSG